MNRHLALAAALLVAGSVAAGQTLPALPGLSLTFQRGDVFVALEPGPVQWWRPDGTLRGVLVSLVAGTGEGMGFDPAGNLFVTRWCSDPNCTASGNTVEAFNNLGISAGRFGRGYDCSPHAIVFAPDGTAFVGQAGCTGSILRFSPGALDPVSFPVEAEVQGSFWIDLAPNGCTVFYTSVGPNVKRYDTCARRQLANFNVAPLPGGVTHDLRILPDGGVLVSSGQVVARLDPSGALVRTYSVPGETALWAGLDLAGDGTFWVANYLSSNVYRFDLATGGIIDSFNTGTPPNTAVAVRVRK
jgi:outer membrane protein assembly factor BamB